VLESQSYDTQFVNLEGLLPDEVRIGLEYRVLELVVTAYKKMYGEVCYNADWKENTFSAVFTDFLKKHRRNFSRETCRNWHIAREVYNDDELISSGQADPDKASRIDIVIFTWEVYEEIRFPFECKLVDENNSTLIRLYIKKGLVDRYLTEKDYSTGSSWGGMIGYVRHGGHDAIVVKLNQQINRQINRTTEHLKIYQPIAGFEAIYKSQHQRREQTDFLTITHLFLTFRPHTEEAIENISADMPMTE